MSVGRRNSLQFFFCAIYWILYFSILSNQKIVDLLVYFPWKIHKKIFQWMRKRYFCSILEKVCFKIQLHSFNWYTYCYYWIILWGSCSCVKIIVYKGTLQWVQHVFVKYCFRSRYTHSCFQSHIAFRRAYRSTWHNHKNFRESWVSIMRLRA